MYISSLSTMAVARATTTGPVGQTSAGVGASSATGSATTTAGSSGAGSSAVLPTKNATSITFFSPHVQYDAKTHLEITQYRDPETGKVRLQIPAEKVVEAYRRIAAYGAAAQLNAAALGIPVSATGKTVTAANTTTGSGETVRGTASANTTKSDTVTDSILASSSADADAQLSTAVPPTITPRLLAQAEAAPPLADTGSTTETATSAPQGLTPDLTGTRGSVGQTILA